MTGWKNLGAYLGTTWGKGIIGGGALALLFALFHFFIESRLKPIAASADQQIHLERIITVLKVIPRIGLGEIHLVVILMMVAAKGL
jgi:hypothetical protein